MSTTSPLTWPLGLVTPGHSGLPGSNSGLSSSWLFSTWPDHGLFMRCGETSTQSPRRGLYLHTGEVTSTLATTVCTLYLTCWCSVDWNSLMVPPVVVSRHCRV